MTARMHSLVPALLIALALLTGGLAHGQADVDRTEGFKIGVVDFARVMREYEKREEQYAQLQDEVDALQSDIDRLFDEIQALRERYDANVRDMSIEERQALEEQIESKQDEYRAELARRQRTIDRKERDVVEQLITEVREVIATIGEQQNFHLILEANSPNPPRGGVLYFSPTIDITTAVLEYLNRNA